ncbi:hypothetical protein NECAME_18525, partial [Necator americanus]
LANRAVGAGRQAAMRVTARHARELVHAVERRRLNLVEHVHAVIALELRIVRQRPLLRVEPHPGVLQREEERIAGALARAVHVRHAVRTEALGPVVPARGLRRVDEPQARGTVRGDAFLIQVHRDVRHVGRPLRMNQQRWVIERARRRIDDFAPNAAILVRRVLRLAELDERALAREALPAHGGHPRRIDPAGRRIRAGAVVAVRVVAVHRARHSQVSWQMDRFQRVRVVRGDRRFAASRRAVGRTASIVDNVHTGLLEAGQVGIDDVPVEQRELFVERRIAVHVRVVEIRIAAVAEPDVGRQQREAGLARISHAVAVRVEERARVQIRLPLQHRDIAGIRHRAASERHGRCEPVDDLVVPLVEHRDAGNARGQPREAERAVRVALRERVVFAVRIAHAHIALREAQRLARLAAVEMLVRRTTIVQVRHPALEPVVAGRGGAQQRQPCVDDLRVRKPDRDMETRGPELLEVRRATDLDERVVGLLTVQR